MHIFAVRDLLASCTPLRPVVIYLADGTPFTLGHADYFYLEREHRTLIVSDPGGKDVWIDLALIARAELTALD